MIVTIVKGSAEAGSGENKYDGEKHSGCGFDPRELTIAKGTIVKWINNDSTLKFIIVVSMVLLATNLIYRQVVNGQKREQKSTTYLKMWKDTMNLNQY